MWWIFYCGHTDRQINRFQSFWSYLIILGPLWKPPPRFSQINEFRFFWENQFFKKILVLQPFKRYSILLTRLSLTRTNLNIQCLQSLFPLKQDKLDTSDHRHVIESIFRIWKEARFKIDQDTICYPHIWSCDQRKSCNIC